MIKKSKQKTDKFIPIPVIGNNNPVYYFNKSLIYYFIANKEKNTTIIKFKNEEMFECALTVEEVALKLNGRLG